MNRKFKKEKSTGIPITLTEEMPPNFRRETVSVLVVHMQAKKEPIVLPVIEVEPHHFLVGGAWNKRHISRSQRSRKAMPGGGKFNQRGNNRFAVKNARGQGDGSPKNRDERRKK